VVPSRGEEIKINAQTFPYATTLKTTRTDILTVDRRATITDKWAKNFDKKPHRKGGDFYWGGGSQCHIRQSGAMQSAAAVALMPLLILRCVHRSSYSQCLSMAEQPSKIAPSPEGSRPPSNSWFLGPTRVTGPKRQLDRFSRVCMAHERDQQTDRHTDTPPYSVCSNRPHLATAAMRPETKGGKNSYDSRRWSWGMLSSANRPSSSDYQLLQQSSL